MREGYDGELVFTILYPEKGEVWEKEEEEEEEVKEEGEQEEEEEEENVND